MIARLFAALSLVALVSAPAAADPPEEPTNAVIAVNLFEQSCLRHFADHDMLRGKLAEGGDLALPEMAPDIARHFLSGAPGRVWVLRHGAGNVFALALRDDGLCTVFARRADETEVIDRLQALFDGQSFFAMEAVDSGHDGVMTERFYKVHPGGADAPGPGLALTLSTTRETEGVGYQAAISLGQPAPE